MRTAHDLLTNELRAWGDDEAAAFIRNCVLRRGKLARIANDAAPAIPAFEPDRLWACNVDQDAMRQASIESGFFEGVTHAEGQRRLDQYHYQQEINRAGR